MSVKVKREGNNRRLFGGGETKGERERENSQGTCGEWG